MRGFVKPLIPLNAAKLRIFHESCKYFARFSHFFRVYPTNILSNNITQAIICGYGWLKSLCQRQCRRAL